MFTFNTMSPAFIFDTATGINGNPENMKSTESVRCFTALNYLTRHPSHFARLARVQRAVHKGKCNTRGMVDCLSFSS